MKLAIRITQERNGTYRACCPSLPGCCVCGETRKDAHSKINVAVQGYLASLDVCLPRELSRALAPISTWKAKVHMAEHKSEGIRGGSRTTNGVRTKGGE